MKLLPKLALLNLLCFTVFPVAADNAQSLVNQQQATTSMQNLVTYFQNLGSYLGYDVTQSPETVNKNFSATQTLINMPVAQLAQTYLFYTYLGAIPVNAFNSNAFAQFVPNNTAGASMLNGLANATFIQQNYNAPSTNSVGVSSLIDQQTYQSDPISQAVLNILGTPDYSYCMTYDGSTVTSNCSLLVETMVPFKVLGSLPDSQTFFSYNYIQQFLGQLNSNTLTAPLMYSTDNPQGNTTSSPTPGNSTNAGLTAQTQAQQAANFIRYVTGSVTPIKLPSWKDYDTLYLQATAPSNSTSVTQVQQLQAQSILSKYLTSLRTYAAQNSVGISNLYYIMSKRLPQTVPGASNNTPPMSQALSEFNMATWRLFNTNSTAPGGTQWMEQLNNASSATVQKEMAILLAEINYQMYLDRQLHERLLMTNSILLLQSIRTSQPSTDFSSGQ